MSSKDAVKETLTQDDVDFIQTHQGQRIASVISYLAYESILSGITLYENMDRDMRQFAEVFLEQDTKDLPIDYGPMVEGMKKALISELDRLKQSAEMSEDDREFMRKSEEQFEDDIINAVREFISRSKH